MVRGSLALLYFLLGFHGGEARQRPRQSPVECGDFQFVCPFVPPLGHPVRSEAPIGAAALPSPMKTKEKVEQGKGTADHLMPLGYLFSFPLSLRFFFPPIEKSHAP